MSDKLQRSVAELMRVMADNPGAWIAFDSMTNEVFAIAPTWPELEAKLDAAGIENAEVEVAPGHPPGYVEPPFQLWDIESEDIMVDIRKAVDDPDGFLDFPNRRLNLRTPRELIGTPDERQVREILRGVICGILS